MVKHTFFSLIEMLAQYILGVVLFILIGSLPVFFRDLTFDIEGYFTAVKQLSVKILTFSDLTYSTFRREHPMFPVILDRYALSMQTMMIAFLVALILAFFLSYLLVLFFEKRKESILAFIEIIRSVPDIVVMFLLQSSIIWIYKAYGIKLAQTVSLGSDHQAVLLPLISLSLPIFLFLTQIIVLKIFEELDKQYIIFGRSKGLSSLYLLNIHVIRNIFGHLLSHFKTIVWMMLSTLVMVEFIFNINGLMLFNIVYLSIDLFVVSCILFFTPFFILYRLIDLRQLGRR